MVRFALYLGGLTSAAAAYVIWWEGRRALRRLPAKKAAAMLQEAWADYHTRA